MDDGTSSAETRADTIGLVDFSPIGMSNIFIRAKVGVITLLLSIILVFGRFTHSYETKQIIPAWPARGR